MNATVLKAGALLLLAAAVLGSEEASHQPDACTATEKAVVVETLKKMGQFLQDQNLRFEDLLVRIFRNCDSNGDSVIGLHELLTCIYRSAIGDMFQEAQAAISKPCGDAALLAVDINGDGGLGEMELRLLLTALGVK